MTQPYIGEIQIFGGNFAPLGWSFCNGQTIPISQNDTLFNLIGTTFGGDGQTTFNLPDLQGSTVLHQGINAQGSSYTIGQRGGASQFTLQPNHIPRHSHSIYANNRSVKQAPVSGGIPASGGAYSSTTDGVMDNNCIASAGLQQPFPLQQPCLAMNFILSQYGVYPSP